jgi:hypothetical protein
MDLSCGGKKGVGKKNTRAIGIHPLVKVRSPGQEVRDRVRRAGDMLQCVVEILEELDPPGLVAHDFLWLLEVLEVFVVSADANRMLGTKEEGMAALETEDDTEELFVVGIVVGFCWKETAGVEGNGMKPVLIFLGDDDSQGIARGVRVEDKLTVPIGCAQDGLGGATLFQSLEG